MKRILLVGGMAILCHLSAFAQSSPATLAKPSKTTTAPAIVTTPAAPTQTQAEKNAAALANSPQAQNNIRLGLPATATKEEYAAAKEKLYVENPQRYKELFSPQDAKGLRTVPRSSYNSLTPSQKAHVDAHPELFKIVD